MREKAEEIVTELGVSGHASCCPEYHNVMPHMASDIHQALSEAYSLGRKEGAEEHQKFLMESVVEIDADICSQIFLKKVCNKEVCNKCDYRAGYNTARSAFTQAHERFLKR
jgi:hypothetical protein